MVMRGGGGKREIVEAGGADLAGVALHFELGAE